MDIRFRWHMFITSFIPLWFSIIIIDLWEIVESFIYNWNPNITYVKNLYNVFCAQVASFFFLILIIITLAISITKIFRFLQYQKTSVNKPHGAIIKAKRANKLTSEFLLAYILPMIAFDFSNFKDLVLFLLYFSVLAVLCIRNSNVYTNIYLEFLGYKMYECDIEYVPADRPHKYTDCLIISKQDLTSMINQDIQFWDFEKYIYIDISEGS